VTASDDLTTRFLRQIAQRAFSHQPKWTHTLGNALALYGIIPSATRPADDIELQALVAPNDLNAQVRAGPRPSPVVAYREAEPPRVVVDMLWSLTHVEDPRFRAGTAREIVELGESLGLTDEWRQALSKDCHLLQAPDSAVWRAAALRLTETLTNTFCICCLTLVDKAAHAQVEIEPDEIRSVFGFSRAMRDLLPEAATIVDSLEGGVPRTTKLMDALGWRVPSRLGSPHSNGGVTEPPISALLESFATPGATWSDLADATSAMSMNPRGCGSRLNFAQSLAAHYIHVLEVALPGMHQNLVVEVAWLLATYFEWASYQTLKTDTKHWAPLLQEEATQYLMHWRYSRSAKAVAPTYVRFLCGASPYLMTVLRAIDRQLDDPTVERPPTELARSMSGFLRTSVISIACVPKLADDHEPDEAVAIISKWARLTEDEELGNVVSAIAAFRESQFTPDMLLKSYAELPESSPQQRALTARYVDVAARLGVLPIARLLDRWNDQGWRRRIFETLSDEELDTVLCDCVSWFDMQPSDENVRWCHQMVDTALEFDETSKEFAAAAAYVAVAAVRTNVISALDRLTAVSAGGPRLHVLRESTRFVRSHSHSAPPWLGGRIRSACVALGI